MKDSGAERRLELQVYKCVLRITFLLNPERFVWQDFRIIISYETKRV